MSTIVTGFAVDIFNNSKKEAEISVSDDVEIKYFDDFKKTELLALFEAVYKIKKRVSK